MGFCLICREKWTSKSLAHCHGCHKSFRSVNGFYRHRKTGACLDPETLGMVMDNRGVWATPMTEESKNKLLGMLKTPNPESHGSPKDETLAESEGEVGVEEEKCLI